MRNKILLLLAIISVCLSINAQIKIDFDYIKDNNRKTKDGFTSWNIDKDTETMSINDVTLKVSGTGGTLNCNWYKEKITNELQIMDGLHTKDASGTTSITIEIKGLTEGTHTVQAYHNNVDGVTTAEDIKISVNGAYVTTVAQTIRKETILEAARSNITFSGTSAKIEYKSDGDFYINSFEIDVNNADNMAQNPSPENLDYHVDADDGSVTLSWTPAVNTPTSHIFYFGESEEEVENATSGGTSTTNTSVTKNGLSPLKRYYWRVDEVINDVAYKGDVWSFQPRRLAFPGADGAGKYAIGGRGWDGNGDVYHVTNLNDSGEGSLRYGIESATGPRTIVFDVAGVITLTSDLKCNKPNITVAGQTAPGIGILLRDDSYSADSEDGITRFMRFRFGHGNDWNPESGVGNSNVGNAAGIQTDYHIMDHCLLAWGSDETFASRGAKNITFQHSLIGESLNQNGHKNYYDENPNVQHGYAATIGGETGSYHHNLLAHNEGRNWSMAGGLLGDNFAGKMNIYNNVVYNWHGRTNDGGTHNGNFVNNYYKMMSTAENSNTRLELFEATHEDNYQGSQKYYVAGNIRRNKDGSETEDKEGVTYVSVISSKLQVGDAGYPTYDTFASAPYDCWNVESKSVSEIESAQSAFKNVLSDVGCNYVQLDNNELRLIKETREGTYSKKGSRSGLLGLIDKESDSEGWNGLGMVEATRPTGWDVDGDGIPAWFETAMGWSDADANNNADRDEDYWTDLEEYLNWVAVPHFYNMADDGTVSGVSAGTIDLSTYFAGYTSPSYSAAIEGNNGASASVNGNTLTYDFASCTEKLVTINVTASEGGISLTRSFNFFIDASNVEEPEDPTVTPEGTAYTLSTETYKSSTNTATWNFAPSDLTFTVTNSNDKGYSTGFEKGVKYSAGVQYTIGIPTGVKVDYITFRGYDNYSDADSYIGELNGITYNATYYLFPKKDANENYTVAEHTIQLASPATGSLTFTPAGKQVVWVITLYTSKAAANLADLENTAETESATVNGTITWNFEGVTNSTYLKCGKASDNIAPYMPTISLGKGDNLNWATQIEHSKEERTISNPYKVNNEVYELLLRPTSYKSETPDNTDRITFKAKAKDGCTFTPTNVKLKVSRFITGTEAVDVYFVNNNNTTTLGKGINPERASCKTSETTDEDSSYGQYSNLSYDFDNLTASQENSLLVDVYKVSEKKIFGIGDVIITGTLTYPKTTVTLDEMATVHDLPAAENVTVKMKRGLTAGTWNTFCVPFNLTKTELEAALDDDVEVVKYTKQEGTTLHFEDIENTENIEAGTPYLIRPAKFSRTYDECKTTPITFEGVDLVAADVNSNNREEVASEVRPSAADYSFVGTYVRYIMETDGTELGLNSKNKLAKPAASTNIMRGLRGFFRYNAGNGAGAKVVINGTLTSIDEIDGGTAGAKGVYHVSGRYVRSEWNNGSGLPRGLYIVNGQKMVK